jgi:hypothetical protein
LNPRASARRWRRPTSATPTTPTARCRRSRARSFRSAIGPLIDRAYASDFPVGVGELAPVFVVVPAALPDGMLQSFQTWNQATQAQPVPLGGQRVPRLRAAADRQPERVHGRLRQRPAHRAGPGQPGGQRDRHVRRGEPGRPGGDVLAFYGRASRRHRVGERRSTTPRRAPLQDRRSRSAAPSSRSIPRRAPTPSERRCSTCRARTRDHRRHEKVRRHAARPECAEQPGPADPGRRARHDHLPRLGLLHHRAGRVHRADALGPAADHAARLPPGRRRVPLPRPGDRRQKDRPVRILFRNLLPTGAAATCSSRSTPP